MRLYIDTYGHNRGLWRGAGERARIAAHTEVGVIELAVAADGSWAVNEGPKLNQAGSWRQIGRGSFGAPDAHATWDDDPAQHEPFLVCDACDEPLCSIEERDSFAVLARVVADHRCFGGEGEES